MIYGVSVAGWWMAEISAMFLAAMTPSSGIVSRMSEEEFTTSFIDGARDLLGVALIMGIAWYRSRDGPRYDHRHHSFSARTNGYRAIFGCLY